MKLHFEHGEEVLINYFSCTRWDKAIYEAQICFSSNPENDRFRVQCKGRTVYISRSQIKKKELASVK